MELGVKNLNNFFVFNDVDMGLESGFFGTFGDTKSDSIAIVMLHVPYTGKFPHQDIVVTTL